MAGTNGKGSICAYLSAMLRAAGIRSGRFTSPHLIHRWDCISLDDRVVDESLFLEMERLINDRAESCRIRASEFERLTATAFEIFTRAGVEVAVVETGMGGRLDATNVLSNPLVTVISKIGLDHQAYLGDSLEAIAYHKAGIMKQDIPCIVDNTNHRGVLDVVAENARRVPAGPLILAPNAQTDLLWAHLSREDYEPHQQTNLACAVAAMGIALDRAGHRANVEALLPSLGHVQWPGRLQLLSIEAVTGRKEEVLVDGAHNGQSAEVLGSYVDRRLRLGASAVTWVIAMSAGKDSGAILSNLIRSGDNVVALEFGPVDGMPWVHPAPSSEILAAVKTLPNSHPGRLDEAGADVKLALQKATDMSAGGPLVMAGSLYLVADILRHLEQT